MVRVGLPGSHQNKAVPKEIVYTGKLAPFNQVWVFFFFIDFVAELLSLLTSDITTHSL